jgi:hypothetical protein
MATIRDSVLQPFILNEHISPEHRAEIMSKLAALPEEGVVVLPEEAVIEVITLPGEIPAGSPITLSVSADPAVKATKKADPK